MAQQNDSGNHITVDQIVATLQQLGITLAQDAPFSLMPSSAAPGAPAPNPAVSVPVAAPHVAPASGTIPAAATAPAPVATAAAPAMADSGGTLAHAIAVGAVLNLTAATAPVDPNAWSVLSGVPPPQNAATPTADNTATPSLTTTNVKEVQIVCPICSARQVAGAPTMSISSVAESWYVVAVGRTVGVYQGWHVVQPLVTGVSGFLCKQFTTRKAAEAAFAEAQARGIVKVKN